MTGEVVKPIDYAGKNTNACNSVCNSVYCMRVLHAGTNPSSPADRAFAVLTSHHSVGVGVWSGDNMPGLRGRDDQWRVSSKTHAIQQCCLQQSFYGRSVEGEFYIDLLLHCCSHRHVFSLTSIAVALCSSLPMDGVRADT